MCDCLQVAAHIICALASGSMLLLWLRLDDESRKRVWRLYGWFSGLICFGSCCGAIAWTAWMQYLVLVYQNPTAVNTRLVLSSNKSLSEKIADTDITAKMIRMLSIYPVPYSLEFFCMSMAKLLVLDRMVHVALPRAFVTSQRCVAARRLVVGLVIACNAIYIAVSVVAAIYFNRSADQLVSDVAANPSLVVNSSVYEHPSLQSISIADVSLSVGEFCEVTIRILIIAVFVVVGTLCARRMRSALLNMPEDASEQLRVEFNSVRRKILVTVSIVFLTFLLSAICTAMIAFANALENRLSSTCFNDSYGCNLYYYMQAWIIYTPEFALMSDFISSPLTMLITLWGMTSDRSLQLMRRRAGEGLSLSPIRAPSVRSSVFG